MLIKEVPILTKEVLDFYFSYDPIEGILRWKYCNLKPQLIGQPAGTILKGGNRHEQIGVVVRHEGEKYRLVAHRIIWCMQTGDWPSKYMDHINGDATDNRWNNLRLVSKQGNARNCPKPIDNTSGVVGVSWNRQRGYWNAYIGVNNKRLSLYNGLDKSKAIRLRKEAEAQYGFHENHGR